MRPFTHLTSGFSKKAENHVYAVALHFMDSTSSDLIKLSASAIHPRWMLV